MNKYVKDRRQAKGDTYLYEILYSGENYYLCKSKGSPDTWGYHRIIKHVDAELVDDVIRVGDKVISKVSGFKWEVVYKYTNKKNLDVLLCEKRDGTVGVFDPQFLEKCYD